MKTLKRAAVVVLAIMLAFAAPMFSLAQPVTARAATATEEKTETLYETKRTDKSKTYTYKDSSITVDNYYERIVLSGDTAAIKKINKFLLNKSREFFNCESDIHSIAKETVKERGGEDTYNDCASQYVSYMDENIVCVCESQFWYAGGVSNDTLNGYVFNLKTGKRITDITKFTKSSSIKKVRKQIIKGIEALNLDYDTKIINSRKKTDFNFMIDENKNIYVFFAPYELGYGGWTNTIMLSSNLA